MEQSVLVLVLLIFLLAAAFAWLLGARGRAQAIWAVALVGLNLTGLGTAIMLVTLYWWAPALQSSAPGGRPNVMTGLAILVPLVLGWALELPGILLTLTICLLGLIRTAQTRTVWF